MQLRLHRSHRSYASRLVGSLRFVVQTSTLISLVALGGFCTLMGWFHGWLPWLLSAGATWAYVFYVFLSAARGVELDVPDFSSLSDVTGPLWRGVVSSVYVWGPALAYALFSGAFSPGEDSPSPLTDPLFLLILGWGLFYAPLAFMVAATNTSLVHLFNPIALVGWVFKLGRDYFIALGVMGASVVADILLGVLRSALVKTEVPLVSSFLPELLSLVVPFFMAHALGLLLYVHGDKVGYGLEDDYYEPVLPGARPQGKLASKTPQHLGGQAAPVREPVAQRAPAAPVSGEEEVRLSVPDAGDALRVVADAVAARDAAGAVRSYRELVSSVLSHLAPEQHLFVGRAAASTGDFALAAKAFEKAADVAPDSPVAPQALVLLARLCAERMQDPARAYSVYRYIVHRYPDTDASRYAAQRLPPEA